MVTAVGNDGNTVAGHLCHIGNGDGNMKEPDRKGHIFSLYVRIIDTYHPDIERH